MSRLGFIPPQLPSLTDQPPEGAEWIHEVKHDGYRTILVLEAWLTVRVLPLLLAVIANVLAVVSLIIGAQRLAATLLIIAATLALYSLLDWLTRDRKP